MARRPTVTSRGDGTTPEVTPGGSRRRPGGQGFSGPSGPSPTTEELRARGANTRRLYFSPERELAYRQACEALGLDPDVKGSLSTVWDAAIAAMLEPPKKERAKKRLKACHFGGAPLAR